MGVISPPSTEYTNYYDKARYNLIWKVFRFIALVNTFLTIAVYFLDPLDFYSSLFGLLVPVVLLFVLWKTRKFKVAAGVFVLLGSLMIPSTIFIQDIHAQMINMPYMVMVSLFGFIALGRWVGITSLFLYVTALIVYYSAFYNRSVIELEPIGNLEIGVVAFSFFVAFAVIAYLMTEFLILNRFAEESYIEANDKLKSYNHEIKSRDEEKTVMLKEIHHRVKNNLQVITSLLRLHSNDIKDEHARRQFDDAINRVTAMSMIHEKMYRTQKIGDLYLDEYLNDLAEELISSYSFTKPVSVEVDSTSLKLGNQTIVPLALIFNELISNSLKHAFSRRDSGKIEVFLTENQDGHLNLNYADNGEWKEPKAESTFGLELINTLVEQLQGGIKRTSDQNGTTYRIKLVLLD